MVTEDCEVHLETEKLETISITRPYGSKRKIVLHSEQLRRKLDV